MQSQKIKLTETAVKAAPPDAKLWDTEIKGFGLFRRCCITLFAEDSHRESMRLDVLHEQAITRPIPHDELVQLHFFAPQARVTSDLAGQGDGLACAA